MASSSVEPALKIVRSRPFALVAMVVGAGLLLVGLLQTTAGILPEYCPAGTELVAKFNFQGGTYVFEKPAGNEGIVTITNGSATGGSWSSSVPISNVIVKGGPGAVMTTYSPTATSGVFSNAGLPPVGTGNIPDISNVQFCGPSGGTTTTTSSTTTTTTGEGTTTTSSTTSSTTTSSTTTTTQPTTISTEGVTTTTTRPTTISTEGVTTTTTRPVTTSTSRSVLGTEDPNLPRTGSPSIPLIVAGSVLLAAGIALMMMSRFRERRVHA